MKKNFLFILCCMTFLAFFPLKVFAYEKIVSLEENKTWTGEIQVGQYHAEHGMSLFNGSFLPALHWITIINAASLYAGNSGLQFFWNTKFRATIG